MIFLPKQIIFSLHQENKTFFFSPWAKTNNFFPEMSQTKFFFQDMFEDPFNCETGIRGTVTCRLTVAAIEYRLTALISTTKLITRYYSNETLTQCCFNVRPASSQR